MLSFVSSVQPRAADPDGKASVEQHLEGISDAVLDRTRHRTA
jgi:hypothetical protein